MDGDTASIIFTVKYQGETTERKLTLSTSSNGYSPKLKI